MQIYFDLRIQSTDFLDSGDNITLSVDITLHDLLHQCIEKMWVVWFFFQILINL